MTAGQLVTFFTIADVVITLILGVISPQTPAIIISLEDQRWTCTATVPNESMYHFRRGLQATLELDTFPQQDHDYIDGSLTDNKPDADAEGNYRA